MRRRLEQKTFTAPLEIEDQILHVSFPPEWPGDALVLFPMMIEQLERNPAIELWMGTVIERETATATGQMGFKGPPDTQGCAEVGYGVNPSAWGRGFATEMLTALVVWATTQPNLRTVVAECLETNIGSSRVLEKAGFERTGMRQDDEGPLILWRCASSSR